MKTLLLTIAGLSLLAPETALAAPAQPPPLPEVALEAARGGIATPWGFDIGFGATMRTFIDGRLALETNLTWTQNGPLVTRLQDGQMVPTDLASLGAPIALTPGVSVIHDFSDSRIASVLINTANQQVLRQETDISLVLPQLPLLQQRVGAERLGQALEAVSTQSVGLGR